MDEGIRLIKKYRIALLALAAVLGIATTVGLELFSSKDKLTGPDKGGAFTKDERKIPESSPQQFKAADTQKTGSLIVTSSIPEVRVSIDAPDEEVAEKAPDAVVNITPFRISSIPVGKHTLFAAKPGYYYIESMDFEIKANEVTRLNLKLDPISDISTTSQKPWVKKLPIKKERYTLSYDQNDGNIKAEVFPVSSGETEKQQEIKGLANEITGVLRGIGVDLNDQLIEWKIN